MHSPTPWRVDRLSETGAVFVKPVPGQIVAEIEGPNIEADAAFIALAVNHHDELVKALGDVEAALDGVYDDPTLDAARALLTQIGGTA